LQRGDSDAAPLSNLGQIFEADRASVQLIPQQARYALRLGSRLFVSNGSRLFLLRRFSLHERTVQVVGVLDPIDRFTTVLNHIG
jgi:hypothetical protein